MTAEITARFRWTLEELTVASRWHLRENFRSRAIRVVGIVEAAVCVCGGLTGYWLRGEIDSWWWRCFGMVALLGAVYAVIIVFAQTRIALWRMRRNYAKSTGQGAEIEWWITETALRQRATHSSAELRWSVFNKAVLTPEGWLFYSQPLIFHWLPRHAFESEIAFEALSEWVRQKIPAHRELK